MIESREKRTSKLKVDARSTSVTPSCGAVDERDCSMMKHLILAETRRSNAPAWVTEELDKMLNCPACSSSMPRRIAAHSGAHYSDLSAADLLNADAARHKPASPENCEPNLLP
ncbi:MAG: hypothetical protein ACYDHX_14850 [Methanothrix sp.]